MLLEKIERWDAAKQAFLESLHKLRKDKVGQPSGDQSWSADQIAEHLAKVEEAALGYIQKKSQSDNLSLPGTLEYVKTAFLTFILRSPIKIKVPTPVIEPSDSPNMEETLARWDVAHQGLRQLALALPPEKQKACVFRHPLAGYLSLEQTFHFLTEHYENHHRQLKKLASKLPAA
ncbi:MAG: DinB family protein [Calditrichia bacterium]